MSKSPPSEHPQGASASQQLLAAVDAGDSAKVSGLLQIPGVLANVCNKHGETPLHIASGYGKLDIVQILHENNASLNVTDKQGDSPLYWAARHGHLEVVKYLINTGATLNSQDVVGETALHVCARYDQPDVLAYLCQAGAELDTPDNEGDTALLCGTWHGYQSVVECLVGARSSLQCCNKDGETPLHVAAVRGYYSIVKFFCENGADINIQDKLGCTAVQLAIRRNHLDIVQYLCERACDVNIQNLNGDTALHDACREGNLSIFLALMRLKCDLNIPNKNKATPFHLAAKYGHTELIRHLCVAGCDVNAVTENGFTAEQMAANSSRGELAALIHHLRQSGMRDQYIQDLQPGQNPISRGKLLVCGAAGVGKTELVHSLKSHYLQSLFRRRSSSGLAHMIQQRTHGIAIQQLTIPHAGDFSIWDFSGMKDYYSLHEEFLHGENSIVLIVFSLRDPPEKQLAQVRFWLAMIKAKQQPNTDIRFAGELAHKMNVVLVGSFADQPRFLEISELTEDPDDVFAVPLASTLAQASLLQPNQGKQVMETVRKEFKDYFAFSKEVFLLDCQLSQTNEMKALRQHLGALWRENSQLQPKVPSIVQVLSRAILAWRQEYSSFPVLTWSTFLQKTRNTINPLVAEETLVTVVSALHDMGEIVFIKDGSLSNIVILDPMWLGLRIFGPALSPENSIIPQLKSVTGHVTLSSLQNVYPEWDAPSIIHLFEYFELCTPVDESRLTYLFPCLIKMEPLYGLWEREVDLTVYAGIHLTCLTDRDIFSPSLFSKIQICARKVFADDIEDQELTLWTGGFKCCRGEVEVLVRYPEVHKTIEILVRGTEDTRLECYSLLQQFYSLIVDTIHKVNPGTAFQTRVLSSKRLREHKAILSYSSAEIFAAERGNGILRHTDMPGVEERILDVICCGCEELLFAAKSAPYASIGSLPLQTKVELSRLLDPPDAFGRDWCLLSLQLLITEEVPRIDQANDHSSPTNRLLTVWEKSVRSTVVTVVDALRAIGRNDAANALINGLSPFSNPSNSVVISVPGVALTSYMC